MSRNTGGEGSIIIPKSKFTSLAKTIIELHNAVMEKDIIKFNHFVDGVLAEHSGKRYDENKWHDILYWAYEDKFPQKEFNHVNYFECLDSTDAIFEARKKIDSEGKVVMGKPHRLKFKKIKFTKDENISLPFSSESSFYIDPEKNTIRLFIGYNNHNLERAINSPICKVIMGLLKNIEYTKGTGGVIYGSQESDGYDTSPNFSMFEFGPKPKPRVKVTKT